VGWRISKTITAVANLDKYNISENKALWKYGARSMSILYAPIFGEIGKCPKSCPKI